jgi:hypothetical protein
VAVALDLFLPTIVILLFASIALAIRATVLAHGFSNTIGMVTFYLIGPSTASGDLRK